MTQQPGQGPQYPQQPPQPPYGYQPPAPHPHMAAYGGAPQPAPARKSRRGTVLHIAVPILTFLVGIGIGGAGKSGATSSPTAAAKVTERVTVTAAAPANAAPQQAPAAQAPQKPAAAAPATIGQGTFEIPADIKPGKYKTAGPAEDGIGLCYWARLRNTSGDGSAIITNGVEKGPSTVTIKSTDGAFKTSGCQDWVKAG